MAYLWALHGDLIHPVRELWTLLCFLSSYWVTQWLAKQISLLRLTGNKIKENNLMAPYWSEFLKRKNWTIFNLDWKQAHLFWGSFTVTVDGSPLTLRHKHATSKCHILMRSLSLCTKGNYCSDNFNIILLSFLTYTFQNKSWMRNCVWKPF